MTDTNINPQDLLEHILSVGKDLVEQGKNQTNDLTERGKEIAQKGEDYLADKLDIADTEASRQALRKGIGAGAAAGALALLLSSRSGRKMVTLGGLAGLGTIAYKAHKAGKMPEKLDDVIGLLKGPEATVRAEVLLKAMIAAAHADGHLNAQERALIEAEHKATPEAIETLLETPCHASDIAKLATSPQSAAEIYAVSCRIANGLNPKERDYLDRLAMALDLTPDIAARIETDVRTGE